ncbi:hypothetical protein F5Y06DRAFT_301602 [Hypoxylon sp. FL0890]|nr:hypothetical protein F5Y06DRAFT_301602 [Hypoxylon sp. FL0890]
MASNSNDSIAINNGDIELTRKQVELMFAALKHSSRDLKGCVDWVAVSHKTGHGSAKSARDRFSHLGQKFGWCRAQVSMRRASQAAKK